MILIASLINSPHSFDPTMGYTHEEVLSIYNLQKQSLEPEKKQIRYYKQTSMPLDQPSSLIPLPTHQSYPSPFPTTTRVTESTLFALTTFLTRVSGEAQHGQEKSVSVEMEGWLPLVGFVSRWLDHDPRQMPCDEKGIPDTPHLVNSSCHVVIPGLDGIRWLLVASLTFLFSFFSSFSPFFLLFFLFVTSTCLGLLAS
ncbi:hypothetical protein B0T20DRAFT_178970 [Sordaria brevicollis]|uniref:Uncharacterized protein n=1 Tax=Sordaria brevicollis TaxID=83679 RepID=A0AAE0UDJ5_SORBR|nr:hypothetical protein B0T20DRAFT_178970 [Sordaria brevicollis]